MIEINPREREREKKKR